MNCIGTYDGTIFYNPANKFCIVSVKTADQSVPAEARSNRRYKDHLIRFTAVGYEIPRTDAVELELDGEWTKGKYGVQLQVEQWREIVPRTKNGVEGYLASGLIKGIGPKTAADIVERFGVATLDILEHQPERLLEIRGITENKLEDIRASYAENRMLQGIMTLLAPFKITPKTALKIYQYFGPTSVEILEKSPFELCQISGFGFRRVDAIVQKSGGDLHDPMRIKGAVFCALDEGKSKRGHLYISSEELEKSALKLLNEKIPVPELRLHQQEVRDMMQEMILNGAIVSVKDTGSQRECLLAAFDSNKKIILVKKDETVVARACLRLTKGAFQKPPAIDFSFADLSQENTATGKSAAGEKAVLFLESVYTSRLNDIEKEEVMKLAVSLTTQKAAELGVVAVLARKYLGCYERDEYVLAPFYVYISKSKNGWQYLDSLGGAAYTSAKEEYVEHPFLVAQTAMHHTGANNRNEVDYE